ncbi:alpha/beta hydrolase [soil metagenome]
MARPTVFFLHALGGSARSWVAVANYLEDRFDCVALDLPGFGETSDLTGTTVEEMTDWLAKAIGARKTSQWMIVGHSMGAKLAAIIARRASDGDAALAGLERVCLFAGSPPSPEPMQEARRDKMIGWADTGPIGRADAHFFITANTATPLAPLSLEAAIDDVCRTQRTAWLAWLERGSREDWSAVVGELDVPALIVAGSADIDLGFAAQRDLNAPHWRNAVLDIVEGARHLLPLERPEEVAVLIDRHWSTPTS